MSRSHAIVRPVTWRSSRSMIIDILFISIPSATILLRHALSLSSNDSKYSEGTHPTLISKSVNVAKTVSLKEMYALMDHSCSERRNEILERQTRAESRSQ